MIEEYIDIGGLAPTSSVDDTDHIVVRKGLTDKRISIGDFTDSVLPIASTSNAGIVQLSSSTSSTSIDTAATSSAVMNAYNKGEEALAVANAATAQLTGKANTVHYHDASQVVSGIINRDRLPKANTYSHGIVRPTDNLSLSSSQGYVASIESVKTIQQRLDGLDNQIQALELGSAFTPIPDTTTGDTGVVSFPIGTTLLVSAGTGFSRRGTPFSVYLASTASRNIQNDSIGSAGLGMYVVDGGAAPLAQKLEGIWVARGSYSPIWRAGIWRAMVKGNGTNVPTEEKVIMNCILAQRIS